MERIFIDIVRFFQATHDILYVFTFVVASFLLVSGMDDLAVDLYYWFQYLFRRKVLNRHQLLPREGLETTPEKPIAIFVPTWQEQDVIEQMLTRASETIDYRNYDIFVGVYPNDPATMAKAADVARN